nr:uncharacterized protein LOC109164944 [Ipomoea trifida]
MKMDIIDNCPTPSTNQSRYDNAPADLADRVRCLIPKRMQMSWRNRTILEDSDIYTMRHMESYLGQGVSRWECGIVKGDMHMLNDLRKKFMHDILVSNINSHKHFVIQRALEYDCNVFGYAS